MGSGIVWTSKLTITDSLWHCIIKHECLKLEGAKIVDEHEGVYNCRVTDAATDSEDGLMD